MSNRAEEIAKELSRQFYVEGVSLGEGVNMMAEALRAYAEEVRREEREAWLDRAAKIEDEIAGDARYTNQEILGAHMLGASLRADAAAIRAREGKG